MHAWRHALIVLAWLATSSLAAAQPLPINPTALDPSTTGYATFGSYNQKVVANQHGIFVSYLLTADGDLAASTWILKRSVNGGATFSPVHQNPTPHGTPSPTIETDRDGNIYLIHSHAGTVPKDAYLYIFRASTNFAPPAAPIVIPGGSALKFAMMLDEARGQIYYAATTFISAWPTYSGPTMRFYTIGMDGSLRQNVRLTQPGSLADAHYPLLYLDEHGDLYAAWTSLGGACTPSDPNYSYCSLHVMRSRDGGWNWETLNEAPLALPVIADGTGPLPVVTTISLGDEQGQSPWLASLLVKQGKIHLPYRAGALNRPHYVRYDTVTGQKDVDITPTWGGLTLTVDSQDGFCTAHSARPDHALYCVSRTAGSNPLDPETPKQLVVLGSYDNGTTWFDYAATAPLAENIYGITGNREIKDGYISGMYTSRVSGAHTVKFFRIPVPFPTDVRLPATVTASASNATAYLADDNNLGTQWIASPNVSLANNNAWIQLDLTTVKEIRRVRWNGAAWDPPHAQSPADYTVAVSNDGVRWTTVATRTNAAGVINGNETVQLTGRFIRLTTTKVNDGTGWALSFHEFWAEGNDLPPNTRLVPTGITTLTEDVDYPKGNAIDASSATMWLASRTPTPANNVTWAQLDLGSTKRVTRVKWFGAEFGPQFFPHSPSEYVIKVSNNGSTWRTIVTRTTPNSQGVIFGDEFLGVHARYVKLETTKIHDGSGWALGLRDFWAEAW